MKIVIQRVKSASVSVGGEEISRIGHGLLLLVGIAKGDDLTAVSKMAGKISAMRIFEDENGKMNLDILKSRGEILSVPQFTLLADTEKGNRPGFDNAAEPKEAEMLWEKFNECLKEKGITVKEGSFRAHMEVSLINDGPVTFVIADFPIKNG